MEERKKGGEGGRNERKGKHGGRMECRKEMGGTEGMN